MTYLYPPIDYNPRFDMTQKYKNLRFSFLLTLGLMAFSACQREAENQASRSGGAGPTVKAFVAKPVDFHREFEASGTLLPNEFVILRPEISARITGIYFNEGTAVKKGDLLVQLYDEDIKSTIQKLEAQIALAKSTLEREKGLADIGGISLQQLESSQTSLQSLEADLSLARTQLRATRILAPFSGRIGLRKVSPGALVNPNTEIARLSQIHPLKLDFQVPDKYAEATRVKRPIQFKQTGSEALYDGEIIAQEPAADPQTRTIQIRALVPNPEGELVPGSFARVVIPLEADEQTLLIPSQAIIPTSREKQVAKVKDGLVHFQPVTTGARTEKSVEIIQGLQPGDTILLTALMQVKEGVPVQIGEVVDSL